MKRFSVDIDCDNEAFDYGMRGQEIARILRALADEFEEIDTPMGYRAALHDANGNHVGNCAMRHI